MHMGKIKEVWIGKSNISDVKSLSRNSNERSDADSIYDNESERLQMGTHEGPQLTTGGGAGLGQINMTELDMEIPSCTCVESQALKCDLESSRDSKVDEDHPPATGQPKLEKSGSEDEGEEGLRHLNATDSISKESLKDQLTSFDAIRAFVLEQPYSLKTSIEEIKQEFENDVYTFAIDTRFSENEAKLEARQALGVYETTRANACTEAIKGTVSTIEVAAAKISVIEHSVSADQNTKQGGGLSDYSKDIYVRKGRSVNVADTTMPNILPSYSWSSQASTKSEPTSENPPIKPASFVAAKKTRPKPGPKRSSHFSSSANKSGLLKPVPPEKELLRNTETIRRQALEVEHCAASYVLPKLKAETREIKNPKESAEQNIAKISVMGEVDNADEKEKGSEMLADAQAVDTRVLMVKATDLIVAQAGNRKLKRKKREINKSNFQIASDEAIDVSAANFAPQKPKTKGRKVATGATNRGGAIQSTHDARKQVGDINGNNALVKIRSKVSKENEGKMTELVAHTYFAISAINEAKSDDQNNLTAGALSGNNGDPDMGSKAEGKSAAAGDQLKAQLQKQRKKLKRKRRLTAEIVAKNAAWLDGKLDMQLVVDPAREFFISEYDGNLTNTSLVNCQSRNHSSNGFREVTQAISNEDTRYGVSVAATDLLVVKSINKKSLQPFAESTQISTQVDHKQKRSSKCQPQRLNISMTCTVNDSLLSRDHRQKRAKFHVAVATESESLKSIHSISVKDVTGVSLLDSDFGHVTEYEDLNEYYFAVGISPQYTRTDLSSNGTKLQFQATSRDPPSMVGVAIYRTPACRISTEKCHRLPTSSCKLTVEVYKNFIPESESVSSMRACDVMNWDNSSGELVDLTITPKFTKNNSAIGTESRLSRPLIEPRRGRFSNVKRKSITFQPRGADGQFVPRRLLKFPTSNSGTKQNRISSIFSLENALDSWICRACMQPSPIAMPLAEALQITPNHHAEVPINPGKETLIMPLTRISSEALNLITSNNSVGNRLLSEEARSPVRDDNVTFNQKASLSASLKETTASPHDLQTYSLDRIRYPKAIFGIDKTGEPKSRKRVTRAAEKSPFFSFNFKKTSKAGALRCSQKLLNSSKLLQVTPRPCNEVPTSVPESPTKHPAAKTILCIPFPPLSSPHFGLIQEKLAQDPFRLLIAVTFLIRTHGKHAIPVFYTLMSKYPTPESLAAASKEDIIIIIKHLGLQNQRASTYQMYAKIWLESPPIKGKRYTVRGYPSPDSGRDTGSGSVLEDADPREAWEIGHMTSGPYALDSWRIFCRDQLRGLAQGWNGESSKEGFQPEWMRVLPKDKELRAFLMWMWLKEGFEWDSATGEKDVASPELLQAAGEGRLVWDGEGKLRILDNAETVALDAVGGLSQIGNVEGAE